MFKTGITNLFLRGMTMGSKFLLLLLLAKYLSPGDLGIYGLVVVSISISIYLLGLDFYTYNTRELLRADAAGKARKIRDQAVFHGFAYIIVLPLLLLIFVTETLPWQYAGWFFLLLLLEHISQELYRILTTLSKSQTANVVLFLRSGGWVFGVMSVQLLAPELLSLKLVLGCWILGAAASVMLGSFSLRDLPWKGFSTDSINWNWLKAGSRVSLHLFLATIALLGAQYADRYFLQHLHGETAVGIYTFFWQIANVAQVFVYTGIVMVQFPPLLESFQRKDYERYRRNMTRMSGAVVAVLAASIILLAIVIGPVLQLVGKSDFTDNVNVFWLLLTATGLLTLSHLPHYALYARGKDRAIVGVTILAVLMGITANALLVPRYGLMGAATANCTSMGFLLIGKSVAALRSTRGAQSGSRHLRMKRSAESAKDLEATHA